MYTDNAYKSMGSKIKNDEMYTPRVLVDPIVEHAKRFNRVWCPFDTETSEFVTAFRENGIDVVHSHISTGEDFFAYEPENYDCIVSNPPFSTKLAVLRRLYLLDKPFAMILGLPILNYQEIGAFFAERGDLQLLIVDKKVSFNGKTSSFNNSYFCRRFLPRDLMFARLPHNNAGKNFQPSRMVI